MNNYNPPAAAWERPEFIELIRTSNHRPLTARENKRLDELMPPRADPKEAFIMKPAAEWLHPQYDAPEAEMLFGEFWYRNELCILFADTNVGKSILAVQIGDALSQGRLVESFATPRQREKVLYFDFELSAGQFETRYSSRTHGHYSFGPDFYRLVLNPDATGERKFATYADYINNAVENVLVSSEAKVVIIDNITCLRTGTESAAAAVSLMRKLREMKNRYNLSILVLAHTPKRNSARPITRNDLQGSKMLINFADSAFAIGESQSQPGVRYLKQIKQRSTSEAYGAANVCLCRLVKPGNFLHFEFVGNSPEHIHLAAYTEQVRSQQEEHILQLHQNGLGVRRIAKETGISHSTVHRLLKKMGSEG